MVCNEQNRISGFTNSKRDLLLAGQVFNLVDDVLILALGLEVEAETTDGANDTTYATTPEESVVYGAAMNLIDLVQEPA